MTKIYDFECPYSTPLQSLEVDFTLPEAGWIRGRVKPLHELFALPCTYVFDPFSDMIAWLEQVADGCASSTWCINHEGLCSRLQFYGANGSIDDKTDYLLHVQSDGGLYRVRGVKVERRQLVESFYRAFRTMADDPNYQPREWDAHPNYHMMEEMDDDQYALAHAAHPYNGWPLRMLVSPDIEAWLVTSLDADRQLPLFSDEALLFGGPHSLRA